MNRRSVRLIAILAVMVAALSAALWWAIDGMREAVAQGHPERILFAVVLALGPAALAARTSRKAMRRMPMGNSNEGDDE